MSDNVPLLPEKSEAVCADVRAVLRETFRELEYLPPVIDGHGDMRESALETNLLINDLSSKYKEIEKQEKDLQWEHAKRLVRKPPANVYTLHSPRCTAGDKEWKQEFGLLQRKDLKPHIEKNANCDKTLWVQNILNRSSGELCVAKKTSPNYPYIQLQVADAYSLQSISLGEVIQRVIPPPPCAPPPPPPPAHIVCVPEQVAFVNFVVGQEYTQSLRLVNTSKQEISLSVRPPSHHSLHIELRSGLTVTSGSAAELNLHFSPTSVRTVEEKLSVQVSVGRSLVIPIRCYIEPPVLEILLPHITSDSHVTLFTMEHVQDVLDLGAKLLGDVHRSPLVLKCKELHASFFVLSEESWQDCDIQIVKDLKNPTKFGVSTDCFYLYPAKWSADEGSSCTCRQGTTCYCGVGGGLHGLLSAYLTDIGTKMAVFRIISSTAIVRTLHVVADALMFNFEHITIQAQDKDFDICDESDPYCKYYLHLGTAFPNQTISASFQVLNHSPLTYNYCWRARDWGEDFSAGVLIDKLDKSQNEMPVSVKDAEGMFTPRSTCPQSVEANSGVKLGTQRAVVMLILKDIPKESFSNDHDFIIVDSNTISEEAIPGVHESWSREVCSVVYAQVEVRWEVVPIRFFLDPPFIRLSCSRRVKSLTIPLKVRQLYGVQAVVTKFDGTGDLLLLDPKNVVTTSYTLPLKQINETETDVITLTSVGGEWSASCTVECAYTTRRLSLRPASVRARTRCVGDTVCVKFDLYNNTYEYLDWHATCYLSEAVPTCSDFCATIFQSACRCPIIKPFSGNIPHEDMVALQYTVTTSEVEGCFATIIQVTADARLPASSAALLSYRVMAPRLILRVSPCQGDCLVCTLDSGVGEGVYKGAVVLRPKSLRCGERICCRLRVWNITPIGTRVMWEDSSEDDDIVHIKFLPNEFQLEGYSEANITMVLEARRVCDRRLTVRRAVVARARPLYLIVDSAVTGVEVTIEFPVGGEERTDSFVTMKLIQKEYSTEVPPDGMTASVEEIFAKEDFKRNIQKLNICECPKKMVYIPPVKRPEPPRGEDDYPPVEIISTPPLTCVCRCTYCNKPVLPGQSEPYCLQLKQLPKNTVRSRTIILRNEGGLSARWRTAVRHWPGKTVTKVPWSRAPGVSLQCSPACGTLTRDGVQRVIVSFCADTWGVYYDQILIQIENLEPVVLDVWVEVTGPPLQFALRPSERDDTPPVLWMSNSDPERVVRFTNTSQADLLVFPYVLKDHEYIQESLPFRLYLRLYDVLPPTCPCVTAFNEDDDELTNQSGSVYEDMLTGVELYLTSDYGVQNSSLYSVHPPQLLAKAGMKEEFKLKLLTTPEEAPDATLFLRMLPTVTAGLGWYRPTPPPQYIRVRTAPRSARVHASCTEVEIALCALDLPANDVIRLRKHFYLRNTGNSSIVIRWRTRPPWRASPAPRLCEKHCTSTAGIETDMELSPLSSVEMYVEVCVSAEEYSPSPVQSEYPTQSVYSDSLYFYDVDDILLLTLPLTLLVDQPRLYVEPTALEFGVVSDAHNAKRYFTVAHSSPTATVEVLVTCDDEDFRLHPLSLVLSPGDTRCVYVQYTARWRPHMSTITGVVDIHSVGGAGAWCRATLRLAAAARRGGERHAEGDYTDDHHLLPTVL